MANEATIYSSLGITKGNLQYQSLPATFSADVEGTKGPTPGAFLADTGGTDVDLSELTTPGLCKITNIDDDFTVTVGMYDPDTTKFYPMLQLLPGEGFVVRLAPDLAAEYGTGSGTGTTGPSTNTLRVKASVAPANVCVEAFEA